MNSYIDADTLIDDLKNNIWDAAVLNDVITIIKYQPIVNGEPVKHGRWKGWGLGDYYCSWCGMVVSGNNFKYCPYCGAKMEG